MAKLIIMGLHNKVQQLWTQGQCSSLPFFMPCLTTAKEPNFSIDDEMLRKGDIDASFNTKNGSPVRLKFNVPLWLTGTIGQKKSDRQVIHTGNSTPIGDLIKGKSSKSSLRSNVLSSWKQVDIFEAQRALNMSESFDSFDKMFSHKTILGIISSATEYSDVYEKDMRVCKQCENLMSLRSSTFASAVADADSGHVIQSNFSNEDARLGLTSFLEGGYDYANSSFGGQSSLKSVLRYGDFIGLSKTVRGAVSVTGSVSNLDYYDEMFLLRFKSTRGGYSSRCVWFSEAIICGFAALTKSSYERASYIAAASARLDVTLNYLVGIWYITLPKTVNGLPAVYILS